MTKDTPPPARQIWRQTYDRGLSDADVTARTAAIYAASIDPWHLSREQSRFADTNGIIERRFGRIGAMLEIGCGEGYQSAWLARLCDHLTGLDISEDALARARALLPSGRFLLSGLPDIPLPASTPRFDLAVACEVLYFAPDMTAAIARMRDLAPRGLVTGLERKWRRFGAAVDGLPNLAIDRIADADNTWLVATWQEQSLGQPKRTA
jgi:SAM-dependent methyltransferase